MDFYTNGPESFPAEFFTHFGRPTAENWSNLENLPIWSHLGQKDRIVIFVGRVAKMSKKSWETFEFTGVKLRREILSPGEKFGNSTNLVAHRSKRPNRNFRPWGAKTGKKSWREIHTLLA